MSKDELVMERLYFHRSSFGDNEGQYNGSIEFACDKGKISVTLDSKLSGVLLEVCKDNIQQLASEAAATFRGAVTDALDRHNEKVYDKEDEQNDKDA